MSCIWSGNIEHMINALQLRRICDQLTFWVLRVYKPWVTECLDALYQKNIDPIDVRSGQDLKGKQANVQDRHTGQQLEKQIQTRPERETNEECQSNKRQGYISIWDEMYEHGSTSTVDRSNEQDEDDEGTDVFGERTDQRDDEEIGRKESGLRDQTNLKTKLYGRGGNSGTRKRSPNHIREAISQP